MEKKNSEGLTEKEFFSHYNPEEFEKPSVTVDMLVLGMNPSFDGLKALFIRRDDHPYIDHLALPGGFVRMDESAYQAAVRRLKEETGLSGVYLEQLYAMNQPGRDPRMRVISIAYIALISLTENSMELKGNADWFDVKMTDEELSVDNQDKGVHIKYSLKKKIFENGVIEIENYIPILESREALAFDHAEIVMEGLLRLRNKAEYSDIAFNLVPVEFTLPDLQRVYEILIGKELYKTNFRDKVKEKIVDLDKKGDSIIGNKKSKLYKYKKRG